MSPDRWPSERLDALAQQFTDHVREMTQLAVKVGTQSSRLEAQQRDLTDLDHATERAVSQMRDLLAVVDKSCADKVNELGREMRQEFAKTRREIKEEIKDQVALQMAQAEQARQWGPMARAAPYAATITGAAAIIASVITRG